ncbi:MAG: hypothetical protein QM296_07715 [Bacillota bacterium]|nr:hypothetical protein [Bacillota bacterium]
MRWCPGIGAGAKKLSKGGQKLRWCPETGAGTEKLVQGWTKIALVPRNRGRSRKTCPQMDKKCAGAPESGQERKN